MSKFIKYLKHNTLSFGLALALVGGLVGSGVWLAIRTPDNDPNGSAALFAAEIKPPKTYDQPLLIKLSDLALSISPLGASPARAEAKGNVIKYLSAYPNTDIVQTRFFNKIKEDIILKSPGHPLVFQYKIDLRPYDFTKDEAGNLIFYEKGHKNDDAYQRFVIPAPFMIDADGRKSSTSEVGFELLNNGQLTLEPSAQWLKNAKYPVILDPTVEIIVLNIHSHPQQGENWIVDFTTRGQADLKISPNDQATIEDDEFVALYCGSEKKEPEILAGDIIFYPNWQCSGLSQVIHRTLKTGNHTLKFEFGGQTAYAYNSAVSAIVFRSNKVYPCSADTACGSNCTFGGLTYGTVMVGSECFMDRNLGATRAATAYDDSASYGYYYQWGRGSDGHEIVSPQISDTTSTNSSGDVPGHDDFIIEGTSPYDWRDPQNDNLWGDASKTNNPCPNGWHIPLQTEWDTAMINLGLKTCTSNCLVGMATSTLKISAAGLRNYVTGAFNVRGTYGYYWSASPYSTYAYYLVFNSTYVDPADASNRAYGFTARCIKDDAAGTVTSGAGPATPIVFRSESLPPCNENIACGSYCTFNGLVYGSVNVSGQCFMDRNLGADRVATSYDDSASYGYYYQWGRGSDGHEIVSPQISSTTPVNSSSDTPGHDRFILEPNSPWDWRVPQNDNLWGDASKTNNPCPSGWHIPLQTEWDSAMINIGMKTCTTNCLVGMATSTLKLSAAGYRDDSTGAFGVRGSNGYYWSASPYSTYAYLLEFNSTFVAPANYGGRANGVAARCLKDDANSGTIMSGPAASGAVKPIIFRAPVMQTCGASTACGSYCTFNGLVYGSVNVSGQCFMDRNLGADRVATSYDDSASYGYYYQWGRGSDGHEIVSPQISGTTSTNSSGDVPGHGLFILEPNDPYDWRDPQNDNLWGDASKTNNPCPNGWHIPLQTEWDTAMISLGLKTCTSNCLVGMATSTLKISAAGYRYFSTGAFLFRGTYGYYWSASPYSTIAYNLLFNSTSVNPAYNLYRAFGYTARCLKN